MASKLYIGGLSYSTTSDGLREYFAQSGNVLSADRKSTRLNSSHLGISYAVFCLKKKNDQDLAEFASARSPHRRHSQLLLVYALYPQAQTRVRREAEPLLDTLYDVPVTCLLGRRY